MRRDGKSGKVSGKPVYIFILLQFLLNLLIILPTLDEYRFFLRAAVYLTNIFFMLFIVFRPVQSSPHPARKFTSLIFISLALSIFSSGNPISSSTISQVVIYLSVIASLFWVPYVKLDINVMEKLFLLLFIFHFISASLGVLQVYFPDNFSLPLASIAAEGLKYREMMIKLADGKFIYRPMGLTNSPGGAGFSGFFIIASSLILAMTAKKNFLFKQLIAISSIYIGLLVLFMCQARVMLLAAGLIILVFGILLIRIRHYGKVTRIILYSFIAIFSSLILAISTGGEQFTKRIGTLISASPIKLYSLSRGSFLEYTFKNLIRQYPLGVGAGRWGMITRYFDVKSDFWAEIEWTSWVLDGGILLVFSYALMILLTLTVALKAMKKQPTEHNAQLRIWATFLFAYNLTIFALTFVSHPFNSQLGLEFWLINAVFYGAYYFSQQPSIKNLH